MPRVREDRAWKDLVGLCDAVAAVSRTADPLRRRRVRSAQRAAVRARTKDVGDLPARVLEAEAVAGGAARRARGRRTTRSRRGQRAAAFGIRVPDLTPLGAITADQRSSAALRRVETRLAGRDSGTPRDRLRALFGGDLPGVVTFTPRDPDALVDGDDHRPRVCSATRPPRAGTWLDAVGRTRPKAARAHRGLPAPRHRRAAARTAARRAGAVDRRRSLDCHRRSPAPAAARRPAGSRSFLAPAARLAPNRLGGLLIDAWTETVPAKSARHRDGPALQQRQHARAAGGAAGRQSRPVEGLDRRHAGRRCCATRSRSRESGCSRRPRSAAAGHMPLVYLGQRPGTSGSRSRWKATMETYPTWIRLHPASEDETLAISVQARIHDPLWLLGRQWQFGELRHDGGATPIDVRVEGTTAPLTRMRGGRAAAPHRPVGGDQADAAPRSKRSSSARPCAKPGWSSCASAPRPACTCLRMLRAAGLPDARIAFWIAEGAVRRCRRTRSSTTKAASGGTWWRAAFPTAGVCRRAIRARLAPARTPPIDRAEAAVLRAWLSWAGDRFEHAGVRTFDVDRRSTWSTRSRSRGLARRAKCC